VFTITSPCLSKTEQMLVLKKGSLCQGFGLAPPHGCFTNKQPNRAIFEAFPKTVPDVRSWSASWNSPNTKLDWDHVTLLRYDNPWRQNDIENILLLYHIMYKIITFVLNYLFGSFRANILWMFWNKNRKFRNCLRQAGSVFRNLLYVTYYLVSPTWPALLHRLPDYF
jgi:hypothetical protein